MNTLGNILLLLYIEVWIIYIYTIIVNYILYKNS